MVGTSDTAFSPEGAFTRALLATVLYRIAGQAAVEGNYHMQEGLSAVPGSTNPEHIRENILRF